MATIYDVAREAGVSRSTVSRVLNGKKEVNEETRKRIEEAMKKLNYSPNASARSLALQRSQSIGVVLSDITDPFYAPIVSGVYNAADELGYGALFCTNKHDRKSNVNYFNMLYGKVDGIIFIGVNSSSRGELVRLMDEKYPVAFIEGNFNLPGIVNINVDNHQGAYNATRHLIQLGHRRIAHLEASRVSFEGSDRLKGYTQAMQDYCIDTYDELIVQGDFNFTNAYEASRRLLEKSLGFTAIFCANDVTAAAFMQAAMEKGVRIPEDISVVGFDDLGNTDVFRREMPPITTVRQPRKEMGDYAVRAIVANITNKEIWENKIFNTELIVRDSTTACK